MTVYYTKEHEWIRVDGNSAFGNQFHYQTYPKGSLAYNVSQESFWPKSLLPTMKLRFAYGASGVRFLTRAKPRHDITGLTKTIALAEPILAGLGFGQGRVATIETTARQPFGDRSSPFTTK